MILYFLENDQDLTRRNLVDWSRSECGKGEAHEPFELSQCCRRLLVATLLVRQFARDGRERVRALFGLRCLCGLLDLGRVLAAGQGLPGRFAGVPSVFQTDFGINAYGKCLLNASEAVSESPPFRAIGRNPQCSPPPSESLMIFGPGSARFIVRSVRVMLVPTERGLAAYQRMYQRFCWTQANSPETPLDARKA